MILKWVVTNVFSSGQYWIIHWIHGIFIFSQPITPCSIIRQHSIIGRCTGQNVSTDMGFKGRSWLPTKAYMTSITPWCHPVMFGKVHHPYPHQCLQINIEKIHFMRNQNCGMNDTTWKFCDTSVTACPLTFLQKWFVFLKPVPFCVVLVWKHIRYGYTMRFIGCELVDSYLIAFKFAQ